MVSSMCLFMKKALNVNWGNMLVHRDTNNKHSVKMREQLGNAVTTSVMTIENKFYF